MDILYILMAVIVGMTGVLPTNTQPVVASSFDIESTTSVLNGVNPVETIITPKPEPEKPKQVQIKQATVQTKQSFYASVEAELSNIPAQGSCFDYVPEMATKYGVDADLMTRIIKAESGGNALAKNKNSTASGCGQFIRGTWAG
ncbi:MAG: Transglycosylase domain, partial [Candidatus Parcubacteria bacterium]